MDLIAKQCIDAPPEEIDDRLMDEMENSGMVPANTSEKWKQANARKRGRYRDDVHNSDDPQSCPHDLEPSFTKRRSCKCIIEDKPEGFVKLERIQLYELDKKPLMIEETNEPDSEDKYCSYDSKPLFDSDKPIIDPYDEKSLKPYNNEEIEKSRADDEKFDEVDQTCIESISEIDTNEKSLEEDKKANHFDNKVNRLEKETALNKTVLMPSEYHKQIVESLEINPMETSIGEHLAETSNITFAPGKGLTDISKPLVFQSRKLSGKDTKYTGKGRDSTFNPPEVVETDMEEFKLQLSTEKKVPPKKINQEDNAKKTTVLEELETIVQPQKFLYTVPYSRESAEKKDKSLRKLYRRKMKYPSRSLLPKPVPMLQAQETFYSTPSKEELTNTLLSTETTKTKDRQTNPEKYIQDLSAAKSNQVEKYPTQVLLSERTVKSTGKEIDPQVLIEKSKLDKTSHLIQQSLIVSPEPPKPPTGLPTNKNSTSYFNRDVSGAMFC